MKASFRLVISLTFHYICPTPAMRSPFAGFAPFEHIHTSMKIIATSDWHLGHQLYNYQREAEQHSMLNQLAEYVREHRPDALLIAGDVYDTIQPSAAVQTLFANALVQIHEAHPAMVIVCIAGNHDSGSRHMIFSTPWKALNVHMIGTIAKDSPLDDYVVKIPGKGYIAAIPFAADRFMPDNVFEKVAQFVGSQNASEQLPVVLMAHLAIKGSNYQGHELSTDSVIGGLDCQDAAVFGNGYDYVALGHIHKNQSVHPDRHIWYSGTPIPVSFDEVYPGNKHGVMLMECNQHGGEVHARLLPIRNIRPLVNIPANGYASWQEVKHEFEHFPDDLEAYIRLNVEVDEHLPAGINDEAAAIAKGKACHFCLINSRRKALAETGNAARTYTTSELKALDPVDVAQMWVESKQMVFDDTMKAVLNEVKQYIQLHPDEATEA